MIIHSCNPNAQQEVSDLLCYLNTIEGKKILTGQHTKTYEQEELEYIFSQTGKLPAICGFELLAYSPNINLADATEECITEVKQNKNTINKVWEWVRKGGIVTLTWHWFSPIGGRDKSFYTVNTEFDADKALIEGTPEYDALCHDMDCMAEILQPFCDAHVPILWRPFHEAEGDWFWWGAKGVKTAKKLYQFMFRYYTQYYHLDNLVWVWNCPLAEGYVGDDYCDIVSQDIYLPKQVYSTYEEEYLNLTNATSSNKGVSFAEIGVIPDITGLKEKKIKWLWYMTWCGEFVLTEKYSTNTELHRLYTDDFSVTLDKLPDLIQNRR